MSKKRDAFIPSTHPPKHFLRPPNNLSHSLSDFSHAKIPPPHAGIAPPHAPKPPPHLPKTSPKTSPHPAWEAARGKSMPQWGLYRRERRKNCKRSSSFKPVLPASKRTASTAERTEALHFRTSSTKEPITPALCQNRSQ